MPNDILRIEVTDPAGIAKLREVAELTDSTMEETIENALSVYVELIRKWSAPDFQDKGGVLYILTKFSDGTTQEDQIIGPAVLN